MLVFKILHEDEWQAAQAARAYTGSVDDKRDGFIHLSTSAQLAGTLARHFSDATGLMLVALESDSLGAALKWEEGRDGEHFPHLYGNLDLERVVWASAIENKAPGVFKLPVQAYAEPNQPRGPSN